MGTSLRVTGALAGWRVEEYRLLELELVGGALVPRVVLDVVRFGGCGLVNGRDAVPFSLDVVRFVALRVGCSGRL